MSCARLPGTFSVTDCWNGVISLTKKAPPRNKPGAIRDMNYPRDPFAMTANVRCRYANAGPRARAGNASIDAFLDGGTNGEDLLHALYDYVLDEPIPHSMHRILQEPSVR